MFCKPIMKFLGEYANKAKFFIRKNPKRKTKINKSGRASFAIFFRSVSKKDIFFMHFV